MLVSGINKTPIAKVLSSTLIKCRTPPAYAGNKTTIGLSFNGAFDFVSANESFQYIGAVTVKQISPLYVPTSVGTMLTITGNNFIPNGKKSLLLLLLLLLLSLGHCPRSRQGRLHGLLPETRLQLRSIRVLSKWNCDLHHHLSRRIVVQWRGGRGWHLRLE